MIHTEESTEALTHYIAPDAICVAVGSNHYIRPYRGFDNLYIETAGGRTPRLGVSRYYWDLKPPIVVDFVKELRFGEMEVAYKKKYFKSKGIIYLWVKGPDDGLGAEEQLQVLLPGRDSGVEVKEAKGFLVGPRRRAG